MAGGKLLPRLKEPTTLAFYQSLENGLALAGPLQGLVRRLPLQASVLDFDEVGRVGFLNRIRNLESRLVE